MSRYSPTVTPYVSKGIFSELNDAIQQGQETYRQRKHDEMLQENHAIDVYEHGVRSGTAPVESTADGTGSGLAGVLPNGPSPDAHPDFATALQEAFRASEPGGKQQAQPSELDDGRMGRVPAPGTRNHSGGFDPATHTFGRGGFEQVAPPVNAVRAQERPRYTQLDEGHFIDEQATPEARQSERHLAEFQSERELANALTDAERARKRQTLIAAGVDPSKVEMAIDFPTAAGTLFRPQTQAAYSKLQGKDGRWYMVNDHDPTDVQPIPDPQGGNLIGRTPGTGTARTPAESPSHRETRQNFNAANTQLHNIQSELNPLDRLTAPLYFPSDEARADYEGKVARRETLRGRLPDAKAMTDSLAGAMRGDNSIPGHASRAGGTRDVVRTQDEYDHLHLDLGWSDEKIASQYGIALGIKRGRGASK